jgi:TPP-dependent trihydroxycyclohexane-1,2-dione (THcHDO) dehydratase
MTNTQIKENNMAISLFGKTNTVSLGAALSSKGSELRQREADQAQAAEALAVAASEAGKNSAVAAQHASAVERALKILDDAGVEL